MWMWFETTTWATESLGQIVPLALWRVTLTCTLITFRRDTFSFYSNRIFKYVSLYCSMPTSQVMHINFKREPWMCYQGQAAACGWLALTAATLSRVHTVHISANCPPYLPQLWDHCSGWPVFLCCLFAYLLKVSERAEIGGVSHLLTKNKCL